VIGATDPGDAVWAHDYHLALLGGEIRERAPGRLLLWFLHTPFPAPDLYRRLPWRRELLEGILAHDLVGFQTRRDLGNFLAAVRTLVPGTTIRGAGGAALREIVRGDRRTVAGHFPISIDFKEFDSLARSEETARRAWEIHAELPRRQLILGIDRLDYTKGTRERLLAFEVLLEEHPELHGKITLIQVAVPSRENVAEYQRMREELEREVARINGRFTVAGWIPVHYVYRSLTKVDLAAFYRTCEVALVTPLRDGMNLVAKEYCAASVDEQGVLVLSEFAGAADQLGGPALLVNPHNKNEVAEVLHRALTMPAEERVERIRRLRRRIRDHDVAHWAWDFSRAAGLERAP
jgi:trehalose 6-phosphate synthase